MNLRSAESQGSMPRRVAACVALALLAVSTLTGCYSYVPVELRAVAPGETIRARLSAQAMEKVSSSVQEDGRVEGEFIAQDGDAFTLAVPVAIRQRGFFAEDLHERLELTPTDVFGLERRELDRAKTYLAGGIVLAGVGALVLATLSGKTGGSTIDPSNPGNGTSAARGIHLLRVPIR